MLGAKTADAKGISYSVITIPFFLMYHPCHHTYVHVKENCQNNNFKFIMFMAPRYPISWFINVSAGTYYAIHQSKVCNSVVHFVGQPASCIYIYMYLFVRIIYTFIVYYTANAVENSKYLESLEVPQLIINFHICYALLGTENNEWTVGGVVLQP